MINNTWNLPESLQRPLQSHVGFFYHVAHEFIAEVIQLLIACGTIKDVNVGVMEIVYHRVVLGIHLTRGSPT